MRWGIRKDDDKTSKSRKLNSVTITKKTDNGDSVISIDDAKKRDTKRSVVDKFSDEGLNPADYAPESVALYKFANLPKYNMRLSEEQQQLATNHDAPDYKREINCFECTMAYEMRRRGYNVQANEVPGGRAIETLHAFDVKDSFNVKVSSPKGSRLSNRTLAEEAYSRIEETCLRYGDGARGMMAIYYAEPYDGGHALTWVVENGEFKVIDNQATGRDTYDTFLYCDGNVDVYRLDNADVLPGVTDFVEPFETTNKEKTEAKKRYNQMKKVWKKEGYADEYKEKGKNVVDKLIKDIGKNVSKFVSKGAEFVSNFLKNPLNIQEKEVERKSENPKFTKVNK